MKDIGWFPTPWMPVLRDYENDTSINVLQVNWINPNLSTGFLYHTTGTGAISINSNIVTWIYSWDGLITVSPSYGTVYLYLNTYSLPFVSYTGATQDVNIWTYSFVSTSYSTNYTTDYPYTTSFYTTYTNISSGSVYCYTNNWNLYDYYADGYLYDPYYNIQWTIDYSTGYVDTNMYWSWSIDYISYTYYPPSYTTSISYNGSYFANWINVTRDGASYAWYFTDWTNNVSISDWTNWITTNGDVEITDYTKWYILKDELWNRYRLQATSASGWTLTLTLI